MRLRVMILGAVLVALVLVLGFGAVTPAAAQEGTAQASSASVVYHTVKRGDTVNGIARQYGTSPQAIMAANGLNPPYTIYPGHVLVVPLTPPPPGPSVVYHVVRSGETVSAIARMYGTTNQAIIAANGLRSPYTIYTNQVLVVPLGNYPYYGTYYTVRPGDTLSGIGLRYGVAWQTLAAANGIGYPYTIYVGQTLLIPTGGQVPPPPPPAAIRITSPGAGATVTSPVRVSGWGRASFEQTLVVKVFDAAGRVVGQAPVIVQSDIGQPGPFTVAVPFTIPIGTQTGRIEVQDLSAADGHVIASASQSVRLRR